MTSLAASYAGLIATALFASLLFAIPLAVLGAAVFPALRPRLLAMAPAARARLLLLLAGLPLAGAVAGLLASFMPSFLAWAGLMADHCHLHPDHLHLCLLHPPQLEHSLLAAAFVLAVMLACLLPLLAWVLHWVNTRRLVGQLLAMSQPDAARGLFIVNTDAPLALAAGLHAPRLFLSRSLLAQLPPRQLEAVIAHERAHAARHDALLTTFASALSHLHLPAVRRLLLADLALAAEQACDEAASTAIGDRLAVAEAIVAVEKMFAKAARPQAQLCATSHFTDSNVAERVVSMLGAPRVARPASAALWTAAAFALLLLAALGAPLHHATESLLSLIFH
jgi:Zn-dependent protease with chaperone function